ncbi:MAG: formylglycine-generating enzyme family protein [Polyangiaceae bacterium]|nr:formylglycine-generating enzyme family protein [Polyangiaceae bacterium]
MSFFLGSKSHWLRIAPSAFRALDVFGMVSAAVFLGACAATPQVGVQHAAPLPRAPQHAEQNAVAQNSPNSAPNNEGNPATTQDASANDDDDEDTDESDESPCSDDMVLLDDDARRFCIDRYEASLVEVLDDGTEAPYPHYMPVDGHVVRAKSEPGVFPQGYISEVQAADACAASGKRLCNYDEWQMACMGPSKTTFPYGNDRQPGVCHDTGKSAVGAVFGAKALASSPSSSPQERSASRAPSNKGKGKHADRTKVRAAESKKKRVSRAESHAPSRTKSPQLKAASQAMKSPSGSSDKTRHTSQARQTSQTNKKANVHDTRKPVKAAKLSVRPLSVDPSVWAHLNDPALGQVEGALARTGEHDECISGYGVYDMVGNIHEWVATDPRLLYGTFAGGYYLDTTQNGPGCRYKTRAHGHDYHDYSTGFRCCADAR